MLFEMGCTEKKDREAPPNLEAGEKVMARGKGISRRFPARIKKDGEKTKGIRRATRPNGGDRKASALHHMMHIERIEGIQTKA